MFWRKLQSKDNEDFLKDLGPIEIPEIDQQAPTKVATATFAMG